MLSLGLMPALGKDADVSLVIHYCIVFLDYINPGIIVDGYHRADDIIDVLPGDVISV